MFNTFVCNITFVCKNVSSCRLKFPWKNCRQIYGKSKRLEFRHSNGSQRVALVYNSYFFKTAVFVIRLLLDSHMYKHCNFSRCSLYSLRSVCEQVRASISLPRRWVTAKGCRSKTSHTHKEILSKKYFSCIYSFITLYFFPDCRLSGPKGKFI